ncbi:Coiled-coil domain-containing protein 102A [Gryllus bimaculatus]|nr:Coiled-coil domain-containing protein 102A [Gryllus bimaculatus]
MAQGSSSGTSSRRHGRNDHDTASISSSRYADADWEAKEAMRQRELEEARARATQMEKTMRWWSDCTANWREKWSKVRNERNKAREESKLLRTQLDAAMKDINSYKREKMELETQNDQLKKEVEKIHLLLLKHAGQWDQQLLDALQSEDPEKDLNPVNDLDVNSEVVPVSPRNSGLLDSVEPGSGSSVDQYSLNEPVQSRLEKEPDDKDNFQSTQDKDPFIEEYVLQGAVPRHAVELYNNAKENAIDKDLDGLERFNHDDLSSLLTCSEVQERMSDSKVPHNSQCDDALSVDRRFSQNLDTDSSSDRDYLLQKLSMLQLRLEEASKTIMAEREEKSTLHRGLERLQGELTAAKGRCEELCISRQEVVRELLQLRENDPESDPLCDQLPSLAAALQELQEEASPRGGADRRLAELRTEVTSDDSQLERLQAENASEWGRRERLESDKQALERDNKKLRAELRDLQERLERRGRPTSQTDADTRQLQQLAQELADRTKELADVKHSYNKLKKVLQDKSTELAHAVRRAEQYEAEVKRLRGRVEELKRELSVAEDEVDSATNNIRKLQRTNEELQEQLESLQLQVEHLHSRIRSSSAVPRVSPRAPVLHSRDGSDGDIDDY